MRATLYFSRNPNPRLAVAAARYLRAPVNLEWAAPLAPDQQERFRKINPNLRLPILQEGEKSLWETDAIVCRLSRMVGSNFWRMDDEQPDLIRWISWAKSHFAFACDRVHFERGTKLRYRLGSTDEKEIQEGLRQFHEGSALLSEHLRGREWLVGTTPSYADFRMAAFLPFNDVARLPLDDYPEIERWYGRVERLDGWRDPFEGLSAPELPPVPG
jgi:glutathione S-transferase